jgi:acetoin utilization protein AcuC
MAHAPLFIGSEIYRRSSYGARHPLAIPRVSAVIDLARALGWLSDDTYVDSPVATPALLARFHDPDYIAAVQTAERTGRVSEADKRRFDLGRNGNPVFAEVFRRPATACGASIAAVERLRGEGIVYSPAGGTHHGRPARASGFCYFNDPVLAILAFLDQGLQRVYYVDLDAHHGDGVQDAFADDDRVLTLSIHEGGRWPMRPGSTAGTVEDRAGGMARNLPVPPGFNDSELYYLMDRVVVPLGEDFRPQALVAQCGADSLADDPMSRLELSNGAYWQAVRRLMPLAPRLLVLGGGGYNPWAVARCWTGIWGTLNGFAVPDRLPPSAESLLRSLHWHRSRGRVPPEPWLTTLADPPHGGPVRDEVRSLALAAMAEGPL